MLSIEINLVPLGEQNKLERIAHVQIVNTGDNPDRPDWGNYHWYIQEPDGVLVEGIIENHLRADGALHLLFKVLALWALASENKQMTDGFVRSLLSIEPDPSS